MPITTLSEFQGSLRETGRYETSPEHRSHVRAICGPLTTFRFSRGVFQVFPLCALFEPMGRLTTGKWAEFCFSTVTTAERLGMNVEIDGFEHRKHVDGPVMYLCNHMSSTETILLPPILLTFGPFSFVAKASLAHLPFLERAAAHMGMVPIGRKSPREDLVNILRVGTERIARGDSFLIFPQGTRERVFSRKRFSSIGAKLAERASCPIVPIVVDTRCQMRRETGMFKTVFRDFGPVDTSFDIRVCCGPAIVCDSSRKMHEATFEWMAAKLESWGLPTER